MGEDRVQHLLGIPALPQDFGAGRWMAFARVVLLIGPALVVEIVQQRGQSPEFLIGPGCPGISAHTGLNGQGMFAQTSVLGEFAEQGPSLISGWRHAGYSILSRRR